LKTDNKLYKGPLDPRTVIGFYHVDLRFGDKYALRDLKFQVTNGEFLCLTGPSGAGKSSVLRLIAMDAFPTRGQVIVRGMVSTRMNRRRIPQLRREIGFVFQDFRLLEDRSVYENVAFAQLVVGVSKADIARNVTRILAQVGLWDKRDRRPPTLSGGEQQRVAIARAMVNSPKILLADEPTGNLDPVVAQEIIDLLFQINDAGTCVVFSTHDHEIVKTFGQRVIVLEDGRILSDQERRVPVDRSAHLADKMYRPGESRGKPLTANGPAEGETIGTSLRSQSRSERIRNQHSSARPPDSPPQRGPGPSGSTAPPKESQDVEV
jgi:cell division transport system ATP-binding protein